MTTKTIMCNTCEKAFCGGRAEARVACWEPVSRKTQQDIDSGPLVCLQCIQGSFIECLQVTIRASQEMSEGMVRGLVTLDGVVTVEAAYDPSERWNGWLCPQLDRDAVETVMAAFDGDESPSHRWDGDVLIVTEHDDGYTETLTPDADGRYALGAYAWVWSEVEEEAHEVSTVALDGVRLVLDRKAESFYVDVETECRRDPWLAVCRVAEALGLEFIQDWECQPEDLEDGTTRHWLAFANDDAANLLTACKLEVSLCI